MADGPSRPAEINRRIGSLGRAFDRMRAAMTQHRRAVRTAQASASSSRAMYSGAENAAHNVAEQAMTIRPETSDKQTQTEPAKSLEISRSDCPVGNVPVEDLIGVDSGDEDEGGLQLDDPLRPDSGLREAITRNTFSQYGIGCRPRSSRQQEGPPSKLRRVEKPIRIRIHWTCHECNTQFGLDKTCRECGHRRCNACSRHPPKKIVELSDRSRASLEEEEEQWQASAAAPTTTATHSPVPPATPMAQAHQTPVALSVEAAEQLNESENYNLDVLATKYELAVYSRPRAAVQTTWKSEAQTQGRTTSKQKQDPEKDKEVPVFKAVQRVYRKPRQRVRWHCENCNTLFTQGVRCTQCSHERCTSCHRDPPKRQSMHHDAELLQAVAARLTGFGVGFRHSTEITASAG